jgi:hypothetical protein
MAIQKLPGDLAESQESVNNKQGTSGSENVNYTDAVEMKTYQTRIVSSANKVNLDFSEAAPALRAGLTRAIAGAF